MKRSAVLVNPARAPNAGYLRRQIQDTLAAEGWPEPSWYETTSEEPGERQAQAAVAAGAEVIFVCGGDGTVMQAAAAVAGTEVALAVIPLGSGNVLALNLGLPQGVVAAVLLATRGDRRRIDIGEVEGRLFTVATGMGLDAQMLAAAPPGAKRALGWLAYPVSALRHLRDSRFAVQIRLDGGPPLTRQVRSVVVANLGHLPGGLHLLPAARPDDGMLDIAIISPARLRDWMTLVGRFLGRAPLGEGVETLRAAAVELVASQPQAREVDGDLLPAGTTLRVAVRPLALLICVPRR